MNKKAQSQIITTVLIILLVLAAIVIVWQVVRSTVETSSDTLTSQTSCIGLNLEITGVSIVNTDQLEVKVTRRAGGPDAEVDLILLTEGETNTDFVCVPVDKKLGQLESIVCTDSTTTYTAVPAKTEAGGSIDGVACEFLDCDGTGC